MKPSPRTIQILTVLFFAGAFLVIFNLDPRIEKSATAADPLTIDYLKKQDYPGSNTTIEKKLNERELYTSYIASYESEGLTIKGLLTIPTTGKPDEGFPAIVVAHGDVSTDTYERTEKYIGQVTSFSEKGYVVFMPDYRGHAESEGEPANAYAFPDYTVDLINAVSSLEKHPDVNPEKIGVWSHSTGGHIALRAMVAYEKIYAGVFWGGVVGSYEELMDNWPTYWEYTNQDPPKPDPHNPNKDWRAYLTEKYGELGAKGWKEISATTYIKDINAPIQLHHAKTDEWVPYDLSQKLHQKLREHNKPSELFTYDYDDHNFNNNYDLAMERTIEFFDSTLKSGTDSS